MTAHELVMEARFKALTDAMSPKKRLKFMRRVSEIIGDPAVVPCVPRDARRPVAEAQALWSKIMPGVMG